MLIGVVGGGQLGRMLGLAGLPIGMRFRFLDPGDNCPAAEAGEMIRGAYDDTAALARLIDGAACATYEFENVPAAAAMFLDSHTRLGPGPRSLSVAQDRIEEKQFFHACGVPVQPYRAVSSPQELRTAVDSVGFPAVLKTRRLGYDGKGQAVVRSAEGAGAGWDSLDRVPCIYEAFVPFVREVSLVATRSRQGEFVAHALTRNEHRDGILRVSVAPDPGADQALRNAAEGYVRAIAEALNHVGTLAVEFFVVADGDRYSLIANEMAPRVHNSGHWTIEGAITSQFENHLRAITGLPLGDAGMRGVAAMVNIIGTVPPIAEILALRGARLHLYSKEPKPGRKLGHITVTGADHEEVMPLVARLRELTAG
ncbi:MAG: 5-(carboxyamino)imidazole ribonucleotide synthase [Phycisphaerae bacterium]|nr:5-(carboxyamino)imidazole ribonucleotide synthase [Phycisphaerae bacterium]